MLCHPEKKFSAGGQEFRSDFFGIWGESVDMVDPGGPIWILGKSSKMGQKAWNNHDNGNGEIGQWGW